MWYQLIELLRIKKMRKECGWCKLNTPINNREANEDEGKYEEDPLNEHRSPAGDIPPVVEKLRIKHLVKTSSVSNDWIITYA